MISKVNENENNASAGNRTRIYCLEGNNANLYTTNAEISGSFFIFQAIGLVIHATYFFCTILTDVPLRHHISRTAEYTAIIIPYFL